MAKVIWFLNEAFATMYKCEHSFVMRMRAEQYIGRHTHILTLHLTIFESAQPTKSLLCTMRFHYVHADKTYIGRSVCMCKYRISETKKRRHCEWSVERWAMTADKKASAHMLHSLI